MKHYDSFESIRFDTSLKGEEVFAFNKLDGQNFCVKFNPKTKEFGPFGSKTQLVDETSDQFGDTVRFFKDQRYSEKLLKVILPEMGKKGAFTGIQEITFFFEWYGPKSFAGKHQPGDEMHLTLIDVHLKKKGYLEPGIFEKLFRPSEIEVAELIYRGKLTQQFIDDIWNGKYAPTVKEGVVCKRSTLLKGQKLPKVKVKTKWWMETLHSLYTEEECKLLE